MTSPVPCPAFELAHKSVPPQKTKSGWERGSGCEMRVVVGLADFAGREGACAPFGGVHDDVHVFEELARDDAPNAFGGLDKVVSFMTAVLAAEGIDEEQGFGELFGLDQKTRAIHLPVVSWFHNAYHPLGRENRLPINDVRLLTSTAALRNLCRGSRPGCACFLLRCGEHTQGEGRGQFHKFGAVAGKPGREDFVTGTGEGHGEPKVRKPHREMRLGEYKGRRKKSLRASGDYFHSGSTEFAEFSSQFSGKSGRPKGG